MRQPTPDPARAKAQVTPRALATLCLLGALAGAPLRAAPSGQVLTYHADSARRGDFVVPSLSWARARDLHPDTRFHPSIAGHIYAQPLYWSAGPGRPVLLIATEEDTVYALDARTGRTIWRRTLGRPVPLDTLPCGNIDPIGITGTPAIDPRRHAIYLDALVRSGASGAPRHELFGLALANGATLPGWPVDVGAALARQGRTFKARVQGERGALLILGDTVYVPYGGRDGDCGHYHGWVVGAPLKDPSRLRSWRTGARAGGIWAPGGVSSDGHSLFVATGNTMHARRWSGGEAVIRLPPSLDFSGTPTDYFAPRDWKALDERDADLGGVAPLVFDVDRSRYVLALGKDGNAYLLDRVALGGIGGARLIEHVSDSPIRTAPAEYPLAAGAMIAFQGPGSACPGGSAGDLTVLRVWAGARARISTAWCGAVRGRGAPIVTTTDGRHDPIVWMLGAEGDERLYGFRGDTGQRLFVSAPLPGLRHFQTLIATAHRLYVAADNTVFAFSF